MKIAIVIPVYDSAKAGFLWSLCRMLIYTLNSDIKLDGVATRPALEIFTKSTSILPLSRNLLFMDALKWGADYVLMLDADHVFPPDALIRLLRHQVLFVGANYVCRADEHQASASFDGMRIMSTKEKAAEPQPQEVDHVGLGFCLVNAAVFEKLTAQAAEEGRDHIQPLFWFERADGGRSMDGEDVYFCRKLRAAGVPVYVDHALSREVGHIAECVLGFND